MWRYWQIFMLVSVGKKATGMTPSHSKYSFHKMGKFSLKKDFCNIELKQPRIYIYKPV